MIHTERTVRTLQAVAMTVGLAVFLWSTGLPALFRQAEAASIANASDTITTSAPSQGAVHTIAFEMPNGMVANQTFELRFETGFDLTGLNIGDISMTVDGSATTTAGSNGAGIWGVATNTPTGQDITFTAPTDYGVASSGPLVLTIGDVAGTLIVNPSATSSYYIDIGGGASTAQDTGQVRVAIIDEVVVSASVDTSLTFTVIGVVDGQSVNNSPTSTAATTTPTTLPFGTLTVDQSSTLAHDLTVATNAVNGYSVTVSLSGPLNDSTTGAIIDSFIDGADTAIPTTWVSPSADINDDKTFGHWGITSEDATTTRTDEFDSDEWGGIATSSPTVIMGHTGPADEVTQGVGAARIGYQIEISALQEASDDYNTTLRYIATPTF
jgi:hypothetical protein